MAKFTHWLEKYIIFGWLIILGCAILAGYWAMDRKPPFRTGTYTVFNSPRGGTLFVNANVERDLKRGCSATFSRYIFDSNRVKHDLGGDQSMSASAIERMDANSPGQLRIAVMVPPGAAIGPGTLVTSLDYQCNPLQAIWPIEVIMDIDIEVLP